MKNTTELQAKEISNMKLALAGADATRDIVKVITTVIKTLINLYHIDKQKFADYGVSPETTNIISQIPQNEDGMTAFLFYAMDIGVNRAPNELTSQAVVYMNGWKADTKPSYESVDVLAYIYFGGENEIERFLVNDGNVFRTIDYNEDIATVASRLLLAGKNIPTIMNGFDIDEDAPCNGKSFDVFVTKAGEKLIIGQNGDCIVITDEELIDIATVGIDGMADTIVSAIEKRDFSSLKVTTLFEANFIKG